MWYNLDNLVKVKCNDKVKDTDLEYRKEIKFLGFTLRRAGIYFVFDIFNSFRSSNIKDSEILYDGEIYEKPCVEMYFLDGSFKSKHFDTYDEALDFREKITVNGRWLKK